MVVFLKGQEFSIFMQDLLHYMPILLHLLKSSRFTLFLSNNAIFRSQGLPCHLYFDLEFSMRDNAGKNGNEMVDLLVSIIFEALFEKYSIQGEQDWIVELDSSTKGMLF